MRNQRAYSAMRQLKKQLKKLKKNPQNNPKKEKRKKLIHHLVSLVPWGTQGSKDLITGIFLYAGNNRTSLLMLTVWELAEQYHRQSKWCVKNVRKPKIFKPKNEISTIPNFHFLTHTRMVIISPLYYFITDVQPFIFLVLFCKALKFSILTWHTSIFEEVNLRCLSWTNAVVLRQTTELHLTKSKVVKECLIPVSSCFKQWETND